MTYYLRLVVGTSQRPILSYTLDSRPGPFSGTVCRREDSAFLIDCHNLRLQYEESNGTSNRLTRSAEDAFDAPWHRLPSHDHGT